MNIRSEVKFLKKLKHEYINRPDDLPENVINDLIDLGVHVGSLESDEFDEHYVNQLDNQINLLKSKLKKNTDN